MNKSLIIKLATTLVVAVVVYSVFWFFKLGQLEKRVNKFVTENAAHVSMGEIAVSGFPFSQKITINDLKFNIPTPALDKRQVVVKRLEAVAGIFASEFVVTLPEAVFVQDAEGVIANIEFNSVPEIIAAIDEGRIVKLSYKDSGYRIADDKKTVVYAAGASLVNIESSIGEGDRITTKINIDVRDIDGFTVLDVYKNALEKDIVNGLKTGEIAIGSAATALIPAQLDSSVSAPLPSQATVPSGATQASAASAVMPTASSPSTPAADNNAALPAPAPNAAATVAPSPDGAPATNAQGNNAALASSMQAPEGVAMKSNFVLSAEYIVAPNHIEQQPILDPTKIQEAPMQYTKSLNIVNLKFSNSLYEITINGQMTALPDDSTPSGGLSVKVMNIDNLTKQINEGLNQIMEKSKPSDANLALDLTASNHSAVIDPYNDFIKRISGNLANVVKEIAAKNVVTKDEVAQFDVRREKNLDFLINETPLREVLGKF